MKQKFLTGIETSGNLTVDSHSAVNETVFDVQGSQGQLFSVTNSLSGDLFSVSDISGVAILNVNSSGLVTVDGDIHLGANKIGRDTHNFIDFSIDDHITFKTAQSTAVQIDSNLSLKVIAGSLQISGDNANFVTLTESGSGDFTIDAPDDIRLDAGGGDIVLKTGGTEFGRISAFSNKLKLTSSVANADIILEPNGTGKVDIKNKSEFGGDVTIGGDTGSTGNALAVNRGSDGAQALRIQNSGEVVIPSNYLYATSPGTSMYVQNTAVFRGNIVNDGGDVTIADNLQINGRATATVSSGTNFEARKGAGSGAVGFGGTDHQTGLIEGVDGGGLKLYTAGNDVNWGGAWALNTTWSGTNMSVAGTVTANGTTLTGDQDLSGFVTKASAQSISGNKNFTGNGNQFNGHLYFNAYDTAGNHYPHFRDGTANNGVNINWRHYYGSNYKTHQWTSDSAGNMAQIFQGRIEAVGELKGTSLDINGSADISGNITAPSFTGPSQGAVTGAPDATIWRVSGQYPTWGIFYDEATPDLIQFKSSGNVKATISLDHGDYTGRNATLTGTISASNFSGSSSGTNTGDQTLPTASSLGAVTLSGNQTLSGVKSFSNYINAQGNIEMAGMLQNTTATNSIDLKDHSDYTWFRNAANRWIFQGGGSGDDWTQTFHFKLETVGTGFNDKLLFLGQQANNGSGGGKYKGVRIVKSINSGSVVDGYLQAGDVVITGDLEVQGTTTTVNQTNLDVQDNIIGLNRSIASNANDSGIIIERGDVGNNAALIWDEGDDHFVLGTTTADAASTGSISVAGGNLKLGGLLLDGNTITGVDDSEEFTNDDNHIMTSAAIEDKILGYNYAVVNASTTGSAAKLTDGGGISTHPGTGNLIYTGPLGASVSGLFTAVDNSNSILTVNRHSGNYNSQLGFSSNGNLYYRKFSNSANYTTQGWNTIAFTNNASMLNSNVTLATLGAAPDTVVNQTDFVSKASGGTYSGDVTMTQTSGNNILYINSSGGGNPVIYMEDNSVKWGQFVASGELYFKNETTNVNTLKLIGSSATFAGNVNLGPGTNDAAGIRLIHPGSSENPEVRIQSGESGVSAISIYNTATSPDAEQFFVNNTLGSSHLGNKRGALKLETNSGVVLTLNGANATFAGELKSNGKFCAGDAYTDKAIVYGHLGIGSNTYPKVAYPGYNAQWSGSGGTTGQIVIDLPGNLGNYDMMYMEIDIYEYSSKNATKLIIGGHNWNSGGNSNTSSTMWHNVGVTVLGDMDKPIYFGRRNDGTSERRCIAIGETNSSWSYGTVHVSKVSGAANFYSSAIDWLGDWEVTQTTSSSFFTKNPSTNFNASTGVTFKTHGRIAATGATFSSDVTVGGNFTSSGYVQAYGVLYLRNKVQVLNKATNGWLDLASRDTSGSEAVYNLSNIGTISAAGRITAPTQTLTGSDSTLLTLNPTANSYGGILFQYGGVNKGFSVYNSGSMVYGGESGVGTILQVDGAHALNIDTSKNAVFKGDVKIQKNTPLLEIGTSNVSTGNAKINFYSKNSNAANAFTIEFNKTATADRLEFIDGSGSANIKFNNGGSASFAGSITASNLSGSNTGDQDLSSFSTATGVANNADVTPSWVPSTNPNYSTATGVANNADVTPSWVPSSNPNYLTSLSGANLTTGNLTVDNYKVLDLPFSGVASAQRGAFNPIVAMIRGAGLAKYGDEDFHNGKNSIGVYNNQGGTGVVHHYEEDGTTLGQIAPNSSGKVLRVVNNGQATSPGRGGIIHPIGASNNKTFVQIFQAKIPTAYSVQLAENSQGTGNTSYWLTSQSGTGKWEWYARISHCGHTGTFSGGGHVYLSGGSAGDVFTWYVCSSEVYDVTDGQSKRIKELIIHGGFSLDGNTITGIDNASEFTDNDAHIMTSAAIKNKIADNDNNFLDAVPNHSGDLITSGTVAAARVATLNQNTTGSAGSVAWSNITSKPYIETSAVTSATTTTTVASISGNTYAAVFFDYVIFKSSNIRAGTVVACSDGTSVSFTETSTTDLGDTSDVTLAVDLSSANFRLRATTTSSTWNIKALTRAI